MPMRVNVADDVGGSALQYQYLVCADRARKRPLARGVVIVTLDGLGVAGLHHQRIARPLMLQHIGHRSDLSWRRWHQLAGCLSKLHRTCPSSLPRSTHGLLQYDAAPTYRGSTRHRASLGRSSGIGYQAQSGALCVAWSGPSMNGIISHYD